MGAGEEKGGGGQGPRGVAAVGGDEQVGEVPEEEAGWARGLRVFVAGYEDAGLW